jgi:hypothetical protein
MQGLDERVWRALTGVVEDPESTGQRCVAAA